MVNNIILIASLLTALGVIIGVAIKVYKFIRKRDKEQHNELFKEDDAE